MNGKSDLPREVDGEGKEALSPKKFDADINEDQVLALLKHGNLSSSEIEKLGKDKTMLKSRKLRIAIVEHPKTPRHILLPIIRHLYTLYFRPDASGSSAGGCDRCEIGGGGELDEPS